MDTSMVGSNPKRKLSRKSTPHPSFYLPSGTGLDSYVSVENARRSTPISYGDVQQFDFRKYLEDCCLPLFTYKGKELFVDGIHASIQRERSNRWPSMPLLYKTQNCRGSKAVEKWENLFDTDELYKRFEVEISSFDNIYSRSKIDSYPTFTLPYPDLEGSYKYKYEELVFLSDIQNDTEMLAVLERYVFRTATYAASILDRSDKFDFKIFNSLCKEPFRKWNIYAMQSSETLDHLPLIVVVMHPDDFGTKDFDDLVADRAFNPETLSCPTDPADIVWALLYDTLKGRGFKFVVTNYLQWTFGLFDEDYSTAHVTETVEASLAYLNGECWECDPMRRSVMKMLVGFIFFPPPRGSSSPSF